MAIFLVLTMGYRRHSRALGELYIRQKVDKYVNAWLLCVKCISPGRPGAFLAWGWNTPKLSGTTKGSGVILRPFAFARARRSCAELGRGETPLQKWQDRHASRLYSLPPTVELIS